MSKSILLFFISLGLAFAAGFAGCSKKFTVYYEIPPDMRTSEIKQQTIEKYSAHLKGRKIFIDAGHGGADRKNKSPNGKVIEADVNLKVALALQNYLKQAGAVVLMSREKDQTVDLKERAYIANLSGAELFISIHHNAPGKPDDNWTNYTSTFYHATENDYEFDHCEKDIAKYIQRDVSYVMGTSGGLGSFDGTYSDYLIYPKAGFAVLRLTKMPSVLIELAFHTNRYEEERLTKEEFNKIQAWGIFRGLAKYFQKGIPEIISLNSQYEFSNPDFQLRYLIKDKSGIDHNSIKVFVDSLQTNFEYSPKENLLKLNLSGVETGKNFIKIIAANKNGNHAFPFVDSVFVNNFAAN